MNITVKGDRLIFRSEFKDQINDLFAKHLFVLPIYLLKVREDKPNNSCWPDFNFSYAVTPSDSKIDLERAFTSFLDAVGPYLSNASRLEITNQNGKTSIEFVGPDLANSGEHTGELKIEELGRLVLYEISQYGPALTPQSAALIERVKGLARELAYRNRQTPEKTDQTRSYPVFLLVTNAEGNPAMLTTDVLATQKEYHSGQHYAVAEQRARNHGYTLASSFDENDLAAQAVNRENCFTLPAEEDQPVDDQAPHP